MSQSKSPTDDLLEMIALFMRNSMHSAYLHARHTGFSMPQLNTLMALYKMGGIAISEIAGEMGVTNAAASQMVDRMVQDGLILRTEDPNDRRVKQINLTEKGKQLMREHMDARRNLHEEIIKTLSPEEKQQVHQAFEILAGKIALLEGHPGSEPGNHPKT
jgi:DNA-binding MarR family transcriptional regulator